MGRAVGGWGFSSCASDATRAAAHTAARRRHGRARTRPDTSEISGANFGSVSDPPDSATMSGDDGGLTYHNGQKYHQREHSPHGGARPGSIAWRGGRWRPPRRRNGALSTKPSSFSRWIGTRGALLHPRTEPTEGLFEHREVQHACRLGFVADARLCAAISDARLAWSAARPR